MRKEDKRKIMAKTPAFLFYPADFLVGVMDMTDAEVGKYIRALCYQHAKGHLKQATYDALPEAVKEKFVQDEEGKWYNIRLQKETDKRSAYSESRIKNRKNEKTYEKDMKNICDEETATYEEDMKNICDEDKTTYEKHMKYISTTYELHMENENENINENIKENRKYLKGNKKDKGEYEGGKEKKRDALEESADKEKAKFVKPTLSEVQHYIREQGYSVDAEAFMAYYESNGWKVGRNPMRSWKSAIVTWQKNEKKTPKKQQSTFDRLLEMGRSGMFDD